MLPKNRRIQRKEFKSILSRGTRHNSPTFLLYKMENTKESNTKIAFSVSKKVLKTAVSRNKYRRRGYSLIKKYINLIKPNLFLFFVFKKTNKLPDYQEMDLELNKLLSDSGVLL